MKKQLIKLGLFCFALSLIACGGDSKKETTTDVGQEIKDEIFELELEVAQMDSLSTEIDSASNEVDELLEEL